MGPLLQKIEANSYDNNPNQINDDIKEASQEFNRRAKGENKGEILSDFLAYINPYIIEIQKQKDTQENNQLKSYEKEEYERTIKNLQ